MFQTFLLIATFNIALISITIANYAISASFLGRETRLSRWRTEKRKQKFLAKISKLQKRSLEIEKIKKEIKIVETETKKLGTRIFLLSWLGAVILPLIFFILLFLGATFGMNSEVLAQNLETRGFFEQQLALFSGGSLAIGFMILLFIIRTIDSAARQIPLPVIEVFFENQEKTIKLKPKMKTEFSFCAKNNGEDVAEMVDIFIHFSPDFSPQKSNYYYITKQSNMGEDFPNYNSVKLHENLMHLDIFYTSFIVIETPNKKKNYEIPIYIHERKTGLTKHKLTIKIDD